MQTGLYTESVAGNVMALRCGAGRTRPQEVRQLSIQHLTNARRANSYKCHGEKNVADVGTKPSTKKRLIQIRGMQGIVDGEDGAHR